MPPKKVTGAAAQAKEAKEKKPTAAPAHGKYKGMFPNHNAVASMRKAFHGCRVSMLTMFARYDQGSHPQRESIYFATTSTSSSLTVTHPYRLERREKRWKPVYLLGLVNPILTRLDMQLKERNGSRLVAPTYLAVVNRRGQLLVVQSANLHLQPTSHQEVCQGKQ